MTMFDNCLISSKTYGSIRKWSKMIYCAVSCIYSTMSNTFSNGRIHSETLYGTWRFLRRVDKVANPRNNLKTLGEIDDIWKYVKIVGNVREYVRKFSNIFEKLWKYLLTFENVNI